MSWDVLVLKERVPLEDVGKTSVPIGTAEAIREAISRSLPETNWGDPRWGGLIGRDWSLTFSISEDTRPVATFMIHAGGNLRGAIKPILKLCKETGWAALSMSSGQFIEMPRRQVSKWDLLVLSSGLIAGLVMIIQQLLRK